MPDATAHVRTLRLLQLASAASPVGSFAWSEGLEYAVHAGDVHDESSARAWIGGLLAHGVCALDAPMLVRMHQAWQAGRSDDALDASAWLLACRETHELRAGNRHQGEAMLRVMAALGIDDATTARGDTRISYACTFARAAAHFGIPATAAALAYAYAWSENAVLAAVKLVPLGQSAGQRILFVLAGEIGERADAWDELDTDEIFPGAPGQAIASALHETQTTRLFRS